MLHSIKPTCIRWQVARQGSPYFHRWVAHSIFVHVLFAAIWSMS
jgi:hypothetical protein